MIIFRYLSKELYVNLVAITLILLIILITNQFLHYLQEFAQGMVTISAIVQIMLLQVPLLMGYMLPLGLYLSTMLVLSRLYTDNEMTVMFACGMSRLRLYAMVMGFAVLVTIVVAVVMFWLGPIIQQYRIGILQRAIARASIQKVIPRRFQFLPEQGVFYADQVNREQQSMRRVLFAIHTKATKQFPDGLWDMTVARQAVMTTPLGQRHPFILLNHGTRYIGYPGDNRFQQISFAHYGIKIEPLARMHLYEWPLTATTEQLWKVRKHDKAAAAALQWRLSMPISVLLFALLAVPMSYVRPRQGRFAKMIPAIIIFVGYADLLFLGRSWISSGKLSSALGLWWIHGAVLLIALMMISYRRWRVS